MKNNSKSCTPATTAPVSNGAEFTPTALTEFQRHAQEITERANKCGYNWLPLFDYLSTFTDPQDLYKCLMELYFAVSETVIELTEKGEQFPYNVGYALNHIRHLSEALQQMTAHDVPQITITPHL